MNMLTVYLETPAYLRVNRTNRYVFVDRRNYNDTNKIFMTLDIPFGRDRKGTFRHWCDLTIISPSGNQIGTVVDRDEAFELLKQAREGQR